MKKLRRVKVALDTLGCKLNQAETELLAKQFAEAGYRIVSPDDNADVYILNTCTVTHIADRKSRRRLRLAHGQNPGALVVATGCYAERARRELAQIEGVDIVIGNDEKPHLLQLLEESGRISHPDSSPPESEVEFHPASRTRSFIKVQDGCNNYCTYCIVPLVRGREKSLPLRQVVAEVGQQCSKGYKEAVLTGTEIGSYHYDGTKLAQLVERVLNETDITRLRLSSLQPQEILPELINLWGDRRLCRHFHLSLQSGSDSVLERMGRRYSAGDYQSAVALIRKSMPEAAITTDVIVGFPGETSEEFKESHNFCKQMEFARIHVFPYSPRPGTQAALMPDQVNAQVKKQRTDRMLALARESARNFRQQFLGEIVEVLWEKQDGGVWSGLTDNYIRVYTKSDEDLTNQLLSVKLERLWRDGVWGKRNSPLRNHYYGQDE
ncbi:tRNA (N(6)-L-threonylcarbamoyladenosine(37)-C(2))-methylthiotransferase MtaB [Chloroflexota bacterium]